jgi:hypothetical protein
MTIGLRENYIIIVIPLDLALQQWLSIFRESSRLYHGWPHVGLLHTPKVEI